MSILIAYVSLFMLLLIAIDARTTEPEPELEFYEEDIIRAHEALINGDPQIAMEWLRLAFEPDFSEHRADEYRKWRSQKEAA